MAAGFHRNRHRADVDGAEHERVEQLAREAVVVALDVVAVLVVAVARDVAERQVRVRAALRAVGCVVPRRAGHAQAVAVTANQIELGQDVGGGLATASPLSKL